jgi:hypothetical protein
MPRCQLGIRMRITKRFSSQILVTYLLLYNIGTMHLGNFTLSFIPLIFLMMQRSFRSAALLERALNSTRAE